jgi:putative hemolysin
LPGRSKGTVIGVKAVLTFCNSRCFHIYHFDKRIAGAEGGGVELGDFEAYKPRNTFEISKRKYSVKIVDNFEFLKEVFKMRYEVFYKEYVGVSTDEVGYDFDEYDLESDHLVVVDNESGAPVGTYRFRFTEYVDNFYTESEFKLEEFFKSPGSKLEMGRACILKDHRNGAVMALLWRGLAEYVQAVDANVLFGCSSFVTEDAELINKFYASLKERQIWGDEWKIRPQEKYVLDGFEVGANVQTLNDEEFSKLVPPLLQAYFNAGARVYGYPAHDAAFKCVDVLTMLDLSNLKENYQKKFL